MQSALPGTAVQVMGWKSLPSAGHDVLQVPDEVTFFILSFFIYSFKKTKYRSKYRKRNRIYR